MDKAKFLAILDECVDQEKLFRKLAMEMVLPALEAKAVETDNKIDDAVVAMLKGLAEKL